MSKLSHLALKVQPCVQPSPGVGTMHPFLLHHAFMVLSFRVWLLLLSFLLLVFLYLAKIPYQTSLCIQLTFPMCSPSSPSPTPSQNLPFLGVCIHQNSGFPYLISAYKLNHVCKTLGMHPPSQFMHPRLLDNL